MSLLAKKGEPPKPPIKKRRVVKKNKADVIMGLLTKKVETPAPVIKSKKRGGKGKKAPLLKPEKVVVQPPKQPPVKKVKTPPPPSVKPVGGLLALAGNGAKPKKRASSSLLGLVGKAPEVKVACTICATVHAPGVECKPTPKGMLSTNPSLERYRRATVKQVTMFFDGEAFAPFVKTLERVMLETSTLNHTEALVRVVEFWVLHNPPSVAIEKQKRGAIKKKRERAGAK